MPLRSVARSLNEIASDDRQGRFETFDTEPLVHGRDDDWLTSQNRERHAVIVPEAEGRIVDYASPELVVAARRLRPDGGGLGLRAQGRAPAGRWTHAARRHRRAGACGRAWGPARPHRRTEPQSVELCRSFGFERDSAPLPISTRSPPLVTSCNLLQAPLGSRLIVRYRRGAVASAAPEMGHHERGGRGWRSGQVRRRVHPAKARPRRDAPRSRGSRRRSDVDAAPGGVCDRHRCGLHRHLL